MGRKKRKSGDVPRPRCQSAASAGYVQEIGELQIEGDTSEDRPADSTLANEMPVSSPSPVQSSWFPETSLSDDGETSRETVHVSSSTDSITLSADSQHASLVAELSRLKEQLMPSAKACADAINERQRAQTTPEFEFRQARSICNPFERLGETFSNYHIKRKRKQSSKRNHQHSTSGISQFVNRSAIKLANIDSLLGFCITATIPEPQSARDANEPFVFVDLCGAPGGFSEYILYRHVHPAVLPDAQKGDASNNNQGRGRICGFGMSLSGTNEDGKGVPWNLAHMERFRLPSDDASNATGGVNEKLQYQVCTGKDGAGSIYNWDNVLQLQREMVALVSEKQADDRDCHNPLANLVVADGGFDAQRDSNNQEAIAHKIVVSQTAAALALLRQGGSFVLKMFGCQETATRRMLRYLFGRFDRLTFVKPVLSRPASAERYLVCLGYAGPTTGWDGFLWRERMVDTSQLSDDTTNDGRDRLEELMDSFDIGMLRLNIDTCGSIIEYMDAKRELVHQGHGATALMRREHHLDLQEYEAAWQLHAPRQTGE
ncbi:hypothetical protein ACHAXT_006601 [Thalassiosira profunda]